MSQNMIKTMHPTKSASWSGLLAAFTLAQSLVCCTSASAKDASLARRLELADGVRDGLVPVAIKADQSRWRAVDGVDDPNAVSTIATADIVQWGRCPPWPTGPAVLLADGGTIAGRIESADEQAVAVVSPSLGPITLPAGAVRGYRASQAHGPQRVATADERGDRPHLLLLANDDRVAAKRIDWRSDAIAVELSVRRPPGPARATASIPVAVVRAVDFSWHLAPPAAPAAGPRILVATMDGSRFAIDSLEPAPTPAGARRMRLALRLPVGKVTAECDADDILALAVDGGRATFLAALTPAAYEQAGEFGLKWPLARGHAVSGEWPAIRGRTAFTAVGMHAASRVTYRLDQPVHRFESIVAIDDSAGEGGSVVVRVLAGVGGKGPHEVFSSPVLRGGEEPCRIRVDFQAAADVELVVESADGGAILDRTLWLDPLVVRRSAAVAAPSP